MNFCFIVEERYRDAEMPLAVAERLARWGHAVELLEPQTSITCLTSLSSDATTAYDALVLKTVSDGAGQAILEAADAAGAVTINRASSVRRVRDKAVAAAVARAHGIPMPTTYFVSSPELLARVPAAEFPLVVKPSNGSAGRSVQYVATPADLDGLQVDAASDRFLLAQRYVLNDGYDAKVYCTGESVHASRRRSPLHPSDVDDERLVPVTSELRRLAHRVGDVFGLDVFGVDLLRGPHGWVVVDINDFPSFGLVPHAVAEIGRTILAVAEREARRTERPAQVARSGRRDERVTLAVEADGGRLLRGVAVPLRRSRHTVAQQ